MIFDDGENNNNENTGNNHYSYYDADKETESSASGNSSSGSYYSENSYSDNSYSNSSYSDGRKPRRNKGGFGATVGKAACLGIVFGLVASGTMFAFNKATSSGSSSTATAVSETSTASSTGNSVNIVQTSSTAVDTTEASGVSDIVEEVMPSIVAVNTTIEQTTTDWFGRQYTQEGEGAGSGIIISSTDDDLYILTNYHVIEDSTTVSVQFSDESTADATVKGYDEDGDVAVLDVKMSDLKDDTKNTVKVAVLGDSDALKAGESAIAIGNALGYGQSVTTGVVSATSRDVELTDKTMTLIQTSAAINPGNSGGALLDGKGQVIGMNTVKYSDTEVEGMGYAIPINTAIETAKGIIDGTYTTKTDENTAYLGITGGTVSESTASYYNVPQGVYVSSVEDDSAASRAGLVAGCIITKFNDTDIATMEDLQTAIGQCAPGDSVTIVAQFADSDGNYSEKNLSTILGAKSEVSSDDSNNTAETENYNSDSSDNDAYGNYGGYGGYGNFGGYGYPMN